MKKSKIFIDSNVWFSAFYKPGTCSQMITTLDQQSDHYEIVISELVLEEVMRNLQMKIPAALPFVTEYLKEVTPTIAKDPPVAAIEHYRDLADPKDAPVLAAAAQYQCQHFVTGNLKDYKIEAITQRTKLKMISPREFLKLL